MFIKDTILVVLSPS